MKTCLALTVCKTSLSALSVVSWEVVLDLQRTSAQHRGRSEQCSGQVLSAVMYDWTLTDSPLQSCFYRKRVQDKRQLFPTYKHGNYFVCHKHFTVCDFKAVMRISDGQKSPLTELAFVFGMK